MASKVILSVFLSLFFISQVSSDFRSNEEPKAIHALNGGGDRNLVESIGQIMSKYFNKHRVVPRALTLAPAPAPAPSPSPHPDCNGLCKNRCRLHSRQNMCMRACGTCCVRCKCVPPSTFGNREMCGKCYTDMTTHHNKTKCP